MLIRADFRTQGCRGNIQLLIGPIKSSGRSDFLAAISENSGLPWVRATHGEMRRVATKAYVARHARGAAGPRPCVHSIQIARLVTEAPNMQPHNQSRIYADSSLPLFT